MIGFGSFERWIVGGLSARLSGGVGEKSRSYLLVLTSNCVDCLLFKISGSFLFHFCFYLFQFFVFVKRPDGLIVWPTNYQAKSCSSEFFLRYTMSSLLFGERKCREECCTHLQSKLIICVRFPCGRLKARWCLCYNCAINALYSLLFCLPFG